MDIRSLPSPAQAATSGLPVRRVAVIGAGIIGLSAAWFLQECGVEVTVIERDEVGSGASWGNAGWLTPALATPLPEPAVLAYGLKGLLDRQSALYVPLTSGWRTWQFVAQFATHCRHRSWEAGMLALRDLHLQSLEAYDALTERLPTATVQAGDVVCGFANPRRADALLTELRTIATTGLKIDADILTRTELTETEPALSDHNKVGVRIHGQRYLDPDRFTRALADDIRARGGELLTGTPVRSVTAHGPRTRVTVADGSEREYDATVIATGAWLPQLAGRHGLRRLVLAGRGYSYSVTTTLMPQGPTYFPAARIACTPLGDRLRIAGTMEFRDVDARLETRRVDAMHAAVRPYLNGVDWASRSQEWVGGRPVTSNGLPLIGASATPNVFVAGGHGMWGMTFGPATGRLVAEQIVTGSVPAALAPFVPTR